jgi:hypothetical protein
VSKLVAPIDSTAVLLASSVSAHERTYGATRAQALDSAVILRLNAIRKAHGLVALNRTRCLTPAATAHSLEMLADGCFAYDSAQRARLRSSSG